PTSAFYLFLSHAPSTTHISTLSLHDALPISHEHPRRLRRAVSWSSGFRSFSPARNILQAPSRQQSPSSYSSDRDSPPVKPQKSRDRKSTRLNSSHLGISYAVFCLKKKTSKTL